MFILLTLPILVSGFFVCHYHPLYKQKLYRYEGQYLYLLCAAFGILSFLFGSLLILLFQQWMPFDLTLFGQSWLRVDIYPLIYRLFDSMDMLSAKDKANLAWILWLSVGTLVIPFIYSLLAYLRYCFIFRTWQPKLHLVAKILADSPMDNLLFTASQDQRQLLMLSMDDRKVYVGRIQNTGEPNELEGPDQEVTLLPVMSGYRHKDSLQVTFDTDYDDSDESLEITLRQDKINSATPFSMAAYKQLNPPKPKQRLRVSSITAQVYLLDEPPER